MEEMNIIDVVLLVKRYMLKDVHDIKDNERNGIRYLRSFCFLYVKLGWWTHIKKMGEVNGRERFKSEKVKEQKYKEEYARALEGKVLQ